jgi:flagella basal body P-ring formation protein FlgA
LRRGQPLTAADVITAHHVLADGPLRPRPTTDDAVGGRVLRAVPAGACLTGAMLGVAPLVARGARVVAVVRDGPIEVRAEMIAVEHGGRGDVIRVKHPETQREVRARVLDRDLVEIRHDR